MDKPAIVSAKIPREVYKELVLRVPEGERSNFIREAIFEKLQRVPRPDKMFELEQKISGLEAELSEIKRYLVELEVLTYERGELNPHAFCIDNIDHKIVNYLLHYRGATTSELADSVGANRWLILNRLRKIQKRSRKQLGKPIVEYYAGEKSGKRKAWWMNEEIVET